MADLFEDYALVAQSGLFDADYYLGANPDVAALSLDPLMHYLEKGALELRNPSNDFDARHYVHVLTLRGEQVDNPLLHYIKTGATQGPATRSGNANQNRVRARRMRASATAVPPTMDLLLELDQIRIELSEDGGRLIGAGWCLAAGPVAALEVALGSARAPARYGLPRADVARAYPQYLKSDQAGFEFNLGPIGDDQIGIADLEFTAVSTSGATSQRSVRVDLSAVRAQAKQGTDNNPDFGNGGVRQPPMQLWVDTARVDETRVLQIAGWAVCLAPVSSVQVLVDGVPFGAADYGHTREDVALSHPEYPNARKSGFVFHADASSVGSGDRLITIRAIASTGISRETVLPVSFATASSHTLADPEENKVHCFCDQIQVTCGGRISIDGWAVATAPTRRISVLLDGHEQGNAELGIERPDVGNRFPKQAHARKAGFTFRSNGPEIGGGEHLVVLRFLANGAAIDIPLPVLAVPSNSTNEEDRLNPISEDGEQILRIDLPHLVDGTVVAPIRSNLEIAGWALARNGIDTIEIAIDGHRVANARTGIRRIDVQRAFPAWDGALTAGFSTMLPHRSMQSGAHSVTVTVQDKVGQTTRSEFRISVDDAPDTDGPWALRRKMPLAEADLLSRPLLNASTNPLVAVILVVPAEVRAIEQARITLMTFAAQVQSNWRVHLVIRSRTRTEPRSALVKGLGALSDRVKIHSSPAAIKEIFLTAPAASHVMVLRPGDELGCDAMLEFTVHAAMYPKADFLYCDVRRINNATGKVEAFFKPEWSPDLLHSQNYVGRGWCASATLLERAGVSADELISASSYHLALRLTEHACAIRHVPRTLLQENVAYADTSASERVALEKALVRCRIRATVETGRTPGTHRVRRRKATTAIVSIIIPTCAARGLVKKCIESIRRLTKYRAYEIICIENIPEAQKECKEWLQTNADKVIETTEAFNWSRFNNIAVAASRGEFLLFLNDDIEIIDPQWLNVLLESAARPEIGVTGPQLLYPDGRVQHAGMFLAGMGVARHAFRHNSENEPGYFGLALVQREVICVTGACLMTRRDTFEAAGGFDEDHDVVNNDLDYCLRVQRAGLRIIYTPHTKLIHHELASRTELPDHYDAASFERTWRSTFASGDPYFHPRLAKDRDDYSCDWEPVEINCVGHPLYRRETILRILVVKLDHIGDCITALPAVRKLKHHFPQAKMCVLTGRSSKAVWALEPSVDDVIEFDYFNARSASGLVDRTEDDWAHLRDRLALQRFDLAIDLRKHWETRSVLRFTGARYLAGFDMKGKFPWLDIAVEWSEDIALVRKRQHTTDELITLVDAVAAAGEPSRDVIAERSRALVRNHKVASPLLQKIFRKRVVCVHASVGNEMRQWPPEYFSLLIDQLLELEKVHVILIGGRDEEIVGAKVLLEVTNRHSVWSLVGKVELDHLATVIGRCALFVGNNSGPHHIAAGLGVPTVGIHSGVVDAREWGPKGPTAVAINRVMTCSPCYLSKLEDCGRGLACMRGLLPVDVLRVCQRLLARPSGRPTSSSTPAHLSSGVQ